MNTQERKADRLSASQKAEIEDWLLRYPKDRRQSALLAALRAVQHDDHYLTTEMMDAVADYIGISDIAVYEVASFYSMLNIEKVGRNEIAICTNISCMLRGGDGVLDYVEKKLNIKRGESTADGKFFLKMEEECLADCCGAPMMQVNHQYHSNLTPEKIDKILEGLE